MELPSNDENDQLIVEMLQRTSPAGQEQWSAVTAKDIQSVRGDEPSLILLATSRENNLVRLRGLCKSVRELFPDAKLLVGCWGFDNGLDHISKRLKDAGASAVCTNFLQARQFIDAELLPRSDRIVSQVAG